MVVLCNPTKAVELLATFAAARSRTSATQLSDPADEAFDPAEEAFEPPLDEPNGVHETAAEGSSPVPDALDRMSAFARKVGFSPTRLPAWLTVAGDLGTNGKRGFRFDWSQLVPSLTMNLHLSVEDLTSGSGGVVRWEGEGPITHQFVHDYLRPLHRYVIQPVLDLANQAPVDAYEIPDRHRKAVRLITPADIFPYSSNLSADLDCDHTLAYVHARTSALEKHCASRLGNYGPLGRYHHRIKTHGRWVVRQPFTGVYLWRDPHGQIYLSDCTGTHRIRTHTPAGSARRHDDDLELYPAVFTIEADFTDAG
jgi:hypothetical protein